MTKHKSDTSAPWHMWVIGGLLLLVNGLTVFDYIATVNRYEPYLANFSQEDLSYYYNAPLWMYGVWGIASFGGLISAIFLFMRRSAAVPVFAIAWLSSVIAGIYNVADPSPMCGNLSYAAVIGSALLILIYMRWLQRQGVLR